MDFKEADTIIINNLSRYTYCIKDDKMIFEPKKFLISEEELKRMSLTKSKIQKCDLKNKNGKSISNGKQYKSILKKIWKDMPTQKIVQNTTFNVKLTNEKGEKGYQWDDSLKISIQNKDANGTMKEIIKMCKINNFRLDISIKLEDNKLIQFKI